MAKYASKVVEQAKAWIGKKESDGSHKEIIDIYNAHKPLARGYKVKYTDSWCAAFVSAVAIKLGYTDIIPTECGCEQMINLFKKLGSWVESDAYKPKAGDIIFYDYGDDSAKYATTDNKGFADHVGIVESVVNGIIAVIEGNYNDAVKRRTIEVNGKNIRGYGVPKYDAETVSNSATSPYTIKDFVKEVQKATGAKVDGIAGTETISKTVTVSAKINRKHAVVKAIQKRLNSLGYDCGAVDGIAGPKFTAAVNNYQKKVLKYTKCDGEITKGNKMWKKLLGMI